MIKIKEKSKGKKVKLSVLILTIFTMILSISAVSGENIVFNNNTLNSSDSTNLKIMTTIAVPYDIVSQIAGEGADIQSIVDSATDIHSFTGPTSQQINEMQSADVIFSMGIAGAEPWLADVVEDNSLESKMVNLSSIYDGYGDPLFDGANNPHVWMNPNVVKNMGSVVTDELISLDPSFQTTFENNNATFQQSIDNLLTEIAGNKTAYFDGKKVVVGHPAFYYLFDLLGIERLESIEHHSSGYTGQAAINDIVDIIEEQTEEVIIVTSPQHEREDAFEIASATNSKVSDMSAIPGTYEHFDESIGVYDVKDYVSMIRWCMTSLRNPMDAPEDSIHGYSLFVILGTIAISAIIISNKKSKILG